MPHLTIAIPTYKRNELLNISLVKLLEAGVGDLDVEVRIFDNQSPMPVEATIPEDVKHAFAGRLHIVRNAANVGSCANVVRCMERAEGDWLWILSDDDPPVRQSLSRIFARTAQAAADTVLINFAPPGVKRAADRLTTGFAEFLEMANPLWPYTNISGSIHRRRSISGSLDPAFRAIYTMYPHLAPLLIAVDRGASVLHVPEGIIDFTKDAGFSWSLLELELGVTTLAELPMKWEHQRMLYRHLRATTPGPRAFVSLVEKECPDLAKRLLLTNQFLQRRFADRPFAAVAANAVFSLCLCARSLGRRVRG